MEETLPKCARFGSFRLDLKAGELRSGSTAVLLQEQPLRVLRILVENEGALVSREEIRKRLWPNDTIVEFEHSINAAINKLRKALGDPVAEPQYIQTVARRGYRLMVPVEWETPAGNESSSGEVSSSEDGAAVRTRSEPGALTGRTVSHYRVLGIIGGGGMGVVYRAEDLKLGRRVALKFLPEELGNDSSALQRFEREARTASSLNHLNICTIYEFGEHEGQPFLVMELLEGETLRDWLSVAGGRGLPLAELLDFSIQVTDGLQAAHEKGVIHRDIKPANIFLTNKGVCKILDFGLAKLLEAGEPEKTAAQAADAAQPTDSIFNPPSDAAIIVSHLTRTGLAIGTAGYMSPEQVRGERLDARTDLFSFGLVLYEMATGQRAFAGKTAAAVHEAILNQAPLPVRDLNSTLPPELETVINKSLEKDRDLRYQSAADLRADLEKEQRGRQIIVPRLRGLGCWKWVAAAALLSALMLLIALIVWPLWRYPRPRAEVAERQLTANSLENSVTSAAISPDGKYLAFADSTGVYLKQIRTGETHPVSLPPNFAARVDDWSPEGSSLLVTRVERGEKASLWSVSVFGGSPRQLADDASGGSFSPDGVHIAFRRGDLTYDGLWGREEWVMRSDGTDQVRVTAPNSDHSQLGSPTWSPDGKRIAYVRSNWAWNARTSSIDLNEWQKASAQILLSDDRLSPALHWLPDGRILYAFGSTQQQHDSSLWAATLQRSGKISSLPNRLTGGHGWISRITGTADGKAVIFLRGNWLPSVYIGTLATDGTHLLANRRLTLDENENDTSAWTPDSKAVLFTSDRNGTPEIFRQAIDQPLPESLVSSADQLSQPRMTPDGSEILYISTPKSPGPETLSSIFAIPIGGGTPRLVLKDLRIWNLQCARLPSTICLYSITKGKTAETFRFDARTGKSPDPPQIDPDCNWSLSPDGSERAIVVFGANDGKIHLRSTFTGKARDLVVKGWNELMGVDWSADGKSLLVSWHNSERASALLKVTLDGNASVLLSSSNPEVWSAISSPDGRLLAISEAGGPKNVWQIENF
jgi:eukaryotic-like serine/threonine-protein kinase